MRLVKQLLNPYTNIVHSSVLEYVQTYLTECAGVFQFMFADPPFNIGQDYDEHDDKQELEKFTAFTIEWLYLIKHCLAANGVAVVHIPDSMVLTVLHTMHAMDMRHIEWIIWHYRFGQCQKEHFIRSHAHAICFVHKDCDDWTFNGNDILVPSDRSSKYSDDRTLDSATPGMRVPLDVWCSEYDGARWGRVTGNSKERMPDHPNQLPEKYAERMIRAFTNPDDWVFDMFSGTGTFPTVARALGRNCVATDISESYCDDIVARVEQGPVSIKVDDET